MNKEINRIIKKNNKFFLISSLLLFLILSSIVYNFDTKYLLVEANWTFKNEKDSERLLNFAYVENKLHNDYLNLKNIPSIHKEINKKDFELTIYTKNFFEAIRAEVIANQRMQILKNNDEDKYIINQFFAVHDYNYATLKIKGSYSQKTKIEEYIKNLNISSQNYYYKQTIGNILDLEKASTLVELEKSLMLNSRLIKENIELIELLIPEIELFREKKVYEKLIKNIKIIKFNLKEDRFFRENIELEREKLLSLNSQFKNGQFENLYENKLIKLYLSLLFFENLHDDILENNLTNYALKNLHNGNLNILDLKKKLQAIPFDDNFISKILYIENIKKNSSELFYKIVPNIRYNFIYKNYFWYLILLSMFSSFMLSILIIIFKNKKVFIK